MSVAAVWFVGIGLAVAVAGGLVAWGFYSSYAQSQDRQLALQTCQRSIDAKDPNSGAICQSMATLAGTLNSTPNLANMLFPPETQQTIARWAIGVTAMALAIKFAPDIVDSLREAGGRLAHKQADTLTAATANAYRRRYRR